MSVADAIGNIDVYQGVAGQALGLAQRVTKAVQQASASSGVEFTYLLNNASQESGLNPTAKASTSSATGLFQFVEQTWLRMVKTYGDKYGLSSAADNISIGSDGVARVADSRTKKEILALRQNPEVSAEMAAELTNENKAALKKEVGGKIGSTELYLAHFLGASGAADFLSAMRSNPDAKAADVLPSAASANAAVFYDKSGQSKTLAEVYKRFAQKFENSTGAAKTKLASLGTSSRSGSSYKGAASVSPLMTKYTSSSINVAQANSSLSSTFAAMMIAQMDMDTVRGSSSYASGRSNEDDQKRRSDLSILSMAG